MSTNNFYNHENGIFVIAERTYKEIKELALEEGWEPTDSTVYEDIRFQLETDCQYTLEGIRDNLTKIGYSCSSIENYTFTVENKGGQMAAKIYIESGYYADAQVIVETDPDELFDDSYFETKSELLESYTPHHKRILKEVAKLTLPIVKIGDFSNGEALYEVAS